MKSAIYKVLVLTGALAPATYGFSLFDTAPSIGVPESYAMRYNAYVNVGYDDNVNCSVNNQRSGEFVRFGVGMSYADYESTTKLSYNARIGAQLYNKNANGVDERYFSDISLGASLTHSFERGSVYSCRFNLKYTPEPEYDNFYSAVDCWGSALNWNISNVYSQAINARWSWNVNLAYGGFVYGEDSYNDDRQYITVGTGLSYKASERTTYGANVSYRFEDRQEGEDSESIFVNGSVNHCLTPISSLSCSLGAQLKMMDGWSRVSPTLDFSYRRQLAEGLSARAYVAYSNENVDSYTRGVNYRTVATWRAGVSLEYAYTHRVTFTGGLSFYDSQHEDSDIGNYSYGSTYWSASVGMRYRFTENLTGNVSYIYYDCDGKNGAYERNRVSAGVSYSF